MGETGAFLELIKYFGAFQLTSDNELLIENNKKELHVLSGNIYIRNVNLNRKNNVVFKNLNLEIKGNQITGIIGPIGSGKSSLMKIITGILEYDGDIIIDDQNIKHCNHESVLRHIIYIPQHPILFNKSLYHNITYGSTHNKESVNKILKELDLLTFFNSFPKGLDTLAGKGGNNLSGGQKQMVALTRSLLQNKNIILLDEPSSSLDDKNKQIFMNLVKKLKNKTIIINTHDDKLFEICDKIINIEHIKNTH
jgi:ABC-type bacteriocin/lantibiotic exporter with double-glycine peptidase domain